MEVHIIPPTKPTKSPVFVGEKEQLVPQPKVFFLSQGGFLQVGKKSMIHQIVSYEMVHVSFMTETYNS